MKTTIYIMAICLLALIAIPAITPVESNSNQAFAEFGECPSCWVWNCDGHVREVCMIACLPYPSNGAYNFWVQLSRVIEDPPGFPTKVYEWHYVLMILQGLNRCECDPENLCCHEYTAKYTLPAGLYEFTGEWAVYDGLDLPENLLCDGDVFDNEGPEWVKTPTPTPTP